MIFTVDVQIFDEIQHIFLISNRKISINAYSKVSIVIENFKFDKAYPTEIYYKYYT